MSKSRSFRMTDEEHEIVVRYAKERGLAVGKFLVELCTEQPPSICPEVMCRLSTIRNLLPLPRECWNDDMILLYEEIFKALCALLKW